MRTFMEKRKYKILLLTLFALPICTMQLSAQSTSLSKQINTIKRNSQYIFAEATGKSSVEATEVANMLLEKYVNEYIASQENLDNADNIVVKDIISTSEKIEVPRGTMTRVFVYVAKKNIEPAQTVKTIAREDRQLSEGSLSSTVETVETTEEVADTSVGILQSQVEIINEEPTSKTNTVVDTSVTNDATLTEWQQRVVKEIAKQPTLLDVRKKLNTFKVQNKVKRFGSATQPCQTPDVAFYVFANSNGDITSVLGRITSGGRLNYTTGQQDSLNAHSSETQLWFTLNK